MELTLPLIVIKFYIIYYTDMNSIVSACGTRRRVMQSSDAGGLS